MIQKIKSSILALSVLFLPIFGSLALATGVANAAASDSTTIQGGVCSGADKLSVAQSSGNNCNIADQSTSVDTIITTVINIFSIVVGLIAVIMIVVGGFRYVTSGGKQESVASAKNAILYAIIGLIVVALAQLIVRFVLNKATNY